MRVRKRGGTLVLLGVACALGACGKSDHAADSTKADSSAAATASAPPPVAATPADSTHPSAVGAANGAMSSANILSLIGLTNATEIGAGKSAENKATRPDVKAFAQMMVTDHQAMQKASDSLGAAKHISPEPPAQADQKRQAGDQMMQALNSAPKGPAFDKAYLDTQVAAHQQALNDLQGMAGSTTDADVKALIEQAIPKVQQHLDRAQQLQSKLGKP